MVTSELTNGTQPTERWIRLPIRGYCPFAGLSRSSYYRLIQRGQIKSANLRQPGQTRGVRLIWLPSVLAYIDNHVEAEVAG